MTRHATKKLQCQLHLIVIVQADTCALRGGRWIYQIPTGGHKTKQYVNSKPRETKDAGTEARYVRAYTPITYGYILITYSYIQLHTDNTGMLTYATYATYATYSCSICGICSICTPPEQGGLLCYDPPPSSLHRTT